MKKTLVMLGLASMIGLTACSHENPIEKQPAAETANFLIEASDYASKKMGDKTLDNGDTYEACLYNRMLNSDYCPKFYNHMLEYSEKSNSPFSSLTLKDLENKETFRKISGAYLKKQLENMAVKRKR